MWNDGTVFSKVFSAGQDGGPHGKCPPGDDGVVAADEQSKVVTDGLLVLNLFIAINLLALTDKEQVAWAPQVLSSPFHVVRHVDKSDIVVFLPGGEGMAVLHSHRNIFWDGCLLPPNLSKRSLV